MSRPHRPPPKYCYLCDRIGLADSPKAHSMARSALLPEAYNRTSNGLLNATDDRAQQEIPRHTWRWTDDALACCLMKGLGRGRHDKEATHDVAF